MSNPYTSPTIFLEWMPKRYIAELSDDAGGITPSNPIIQKALDWGAGLAESKLMARSDIPIPALNSDNSVPTVIREVVHDLGLYRLFDRRGHMNEQVQTKFDIQMTWLGDVVARRANVFITDSKGENKTPINDRPVIEGSNENKFTNFTF